MTSNSISDPMSTLDPLERFFLHLVQTLRASQPQLVTGAFDVAELYQSILPYRHHRRALGLESNQDYEMVLLELLSGARGYLLVEERMRDALTQELSTPNPDPARFREFGSSQVMIAPGAAERIDAVASGADSTAASTAAAPSGGHAAPRAATRQPPPQQERSAPPPPPPMRPPTPAKPPSQPHQPSQQDSGAGVSRGRVPTPAGTAGRLSTPIHQRGVVAQGGEKCRYCSGELPAGRLVVFCPNCGQDLSIRNCPACGSELELGWRFCVSCGRSVAAEQGA